MSKAMKYPKRLGRGRYEDTLRKLQIERKRSSRPTSLTA
jgi:hypothetical protein